MKIAIRTDGGKNIGMGHIQRCLAFAHQLKKRDVEIIFVFQKNKIVKEKIEKKKFEEIEIKGKTKLEEDLLQTCEIIKEKNIDILITDSYSFTQDYLFKIREKAPFLVSIDDLGKFPFPSDIVINQNIYAEELNYQSLTGKTKFLLGPKYALLGEEFTDIKERKIKEKIENVLITLGGTDSFNLTTKILNILNEIEKSFRITIAIGSFFKNVSEIQNLVKKIGRKVNLIFNPPDMAKLMLSSDLAISGGGSTLYELAATGTPTIAFCTAENQIRNIEGMEKTGIIINAGWGNNFLKEDFKARLRTLIKNPSLRKGMAEKAQTIVDGKGSLRCTERILERKKSYQL